MIYDNGYTSLIRDLYYLITIYWDILFIWLLRCEIQKKIGPNDYTSLFHVVI